MNISKWFSRQTIYNAIAALLLIAGCVCLVLGVIAAIDWKISPALSLMGAALVLFFAATVERFETLKGLGMEAKLATLDGKIDEASRLLNQIKMVAEITGKTSLSMYAQAGRITDPPSHEEMYELIGKVKESLQSIGSSPATIQEAIQPCTRIMQHELTRAITKAMVKEIHTKQHEIRNTLGGTQTADFVNNQMREIERLEEIRLQLLHSNGLAQDSYPDNLIALLRSDSVSNFNSAGETANELEHFADQMRVLRHTGKLASPDKWFARAREAYSR